MVAFPKESIWEGGKATMQKKARDVMVKAFEAELKELVRAFWRPLCRRSGRCTWRHTLQAPTVTTPAAS